MPIDIAIVEDDAAVRTSLAEILSRSPDCRCVCACASLAEAVAQIPPLRPSVILMDVNLPDGRGTECIRKLSVQLPETQILMLTVHDDPDSIFESLAEGASGYLLKPVRSAQLLAAVKDVYRGGAPMSSSIARKVVKSFKLARPTLPASEALSPREQDVIEHLSKGYSYKETADMLGISYSTVHTHIERIYQKLHVRSRAQAVARYLGV